MSKLGMLGIKDLVYVISIVFTVSTLYYTMDSRITMLEKEQDDIRAEQIDVKQIAERNGKTLETIYFGLVAKGIIDPPK